MKQSSFRGDKMKTYPIKLQNICLLSMTLTACVDKDTDDSETDDDNSEIDKVVGDWVLHGLWDGAAFPDISYNNVYESNGKNYVAIDSSGIGLQINSDASFTVTYMSIDERTIDGVVDYSDVQLPELSYGGNVKHDGGDSYQIEFISEGEVRSILNCQLTETEDQLTLGEYDIEEFDMSGLLLKGNLEETLRSFE
jgi:hypothetical protein